MYGLGLSTKAIQENIKDIYNIDISPELVSRVTDEVKGLVDEWRNRSLNSFEQKSGLYSPCDTMFHNIAKKQKNIKLP